MSTLKVDTIQPQSGSEVTVNEFASNSVAITGGTISGVSVTSLTADLAIEDGGTGASDASTALTNLGVTDFAKTLLDDVDAATARSTLGVADATLSVQQFSGDSSTVDFTLSAEPGSENNTQVYIDGVYQQKTEYSVSGTTLSFSEAPPSGTNNIEVVIGRTNSIGTPGDATVTEASLADSLSSLIANMHAVAGRLTLTSGTPITSSDVTAATTVYFTPYKGNVIPLYDGSAWTLNKFSELSQALSDTTQSPAAASASNVYDLFVWNDGGTLKLSRGPAWSSATSRGTGTGTTELELFEGRYVNKVAITNGPAARRGLYVGTIYVNGSTQVNDSVAYRHVWNTYNRVCREMRVVEATVSWTYTTSSFRQARGSTANQLDMVIGLQEDIVTANVAVRGANSTASYRSVDVDIGVDSTTTGSAQIRESVAWNNVAARWVSARYRGYPGLGRHYLAWLERGDAVDTQTWNGTDARFACGIWGEVWA